MKQYIDSNDLASEVRMARSLDFRAVLIVEGDGDARFFEPFIDHEGCYVLSAHDRRRALAVLRILNAQNVLGVLAVVDADFGRITGTLESDPNLVFCDGHDLEMMLIRSKALDRVISEHASREKLSAFLDRNKPMVIATLLARACRPLGAFLLISLRLDLGLTFEDLAFKDFVEKDSLQIDISALILSVMNKSSRHDVQLVGKLQQEIAIQMQQVDQIWDLACGHDCVELLCFALQFTIGTKKSRTGNRTPIVVHAELLERELRLAFTEADFAATGLFSEIHAWETVNANYRVILPAKA